MYPSDSFGKRCFLIMIAAGVGSVINLYQIKMIIHDSIKELQATKSENRISEEDLRADIELVMLELIRMRDVCEKLLVEPTDAKNFFSRFHEPQPNSRSRDSDLRHQSLRADDDYYRRKGNG